MLSRKGKKSSLICWREARPKCIRCCKYSIKIIWKGNLNRKYLSEPLNLSYGSNTISHPQTLQSYSEMEVSVAAELNMGDETLRKWTERLMLLRKRKTLPVQTPRRKGTLSGISNAATEEAEELAHSHPLPGKASHHLQVPKSKSVIVG